TGSHIGGTWGEVDDKGDEHAESNIQTYTARRWESGKITTKRQPQSVVPGKPILETFLIFSHRLVGRRPRPTATATVHSRKAGFFLIQQIIWELRLFFPVGINEPIYFIYLCLINRCRLGLRDCFSVLRAPGLDQVPFKGL